MRELAAEGISVAITCQVLNIARQVYYRWLAEPVTPAELEQAYRANALPDAHRDDPEFGYRYLHEEAADAGQSMAAHGGPDRVADLLGQPVVERILPAPQQERETAWPAGARRPRPPTVRRHPAQ